MKMISAWCPSDRPSKIGVLLKSSPKTHPIPHMSTAVVYFRSPRSNSGGLYQRVTTKPVYSNFPPPGGESAVAGGSPWNRRA